MTTTTTLVVLGLGLVSTGTAVIVADTPSQDWTLISLLAAVVLGVGGKLVLAADKQAAATADLATNIKLLAQQLQQDGQTRATEQQLLRERLDRLPEDVANELQQRKTA